MRACAFLSQNDTVFHYFNSNVHSNFPFSCRTQIKYYPMHTRYTWIAYYYCRVHRRSKRQKTGENFEKLWIFRFHASELPYIYSFICKSVFFRFASVHLPLHPFETNDDGCLVSYYYNNGDNTASIRQPKHFVYVLNSSVFVHILIKLELAHRGTTVKESR